MRGRLTKTAVGQFKGKIRYAAPERMEGERGDRRVDVWSLGVVLWEATLGFAFLAATTFSEALQMLRDNLIPRPSDFDSAYPPELEKVLLKALEGDPERRFASAAEMAEALEEYVYHGGQPCDAPQIAALMTRFFPPRAPVDMTRDFVDLPLKAEPRIGFVATASLDDSDDDDPTATAVDLPELGDETETKKSIPPTMDSGPASRTVTLTPSAFIDSEFSEAPTIKREDRPAPSKPPSRRLLVTVLVISGVAALLSGGVVAMWLGSDRTRSSTDGPTVTARSLLDPSVRPGGDAGARLSAPEGSSIDDPPDADSYGAEDVASADRPTPRGTKGLEGRGRAADRRRDAGRGASSPSPSRMPGKLNLLAVPPAKVSWRGKSIGRTPLFERAMPAGTHTLVLEPTGEGSSKTITVEIHPGATTRRVVKLR
jgi:serine/threonine-protein kinase